jgi:hypothetical protein
VYSSAGSVFDILSSYALKKDLGIPPKMRAIARLRIGEDWHEAVTSFNILKFIVAVEGRWVVNYRFTRDRVNASVTALI